MDARVVEVLAQNLIFNFVQLETLSANPEELLLPRRVDAHYLALRADVLNALNRVVVNNQLYRKGIISVYPISFLVGSRPGLFGRIAAQQSQIVFKFCLVFDYCFVVHPAGIVYMLPQNFIPGIVCGD